MGAIIVQCPSCQARFHLAQERIPEKGARVRCSRCEHRFYVTSTGDVSESKPRRTKSTGESGAQSSSGASSSSGSSSQNEKSFELSSSGGSQPRARQASREAKTTAMDALREPARARGLGSVAPQEDADLDDPQFLFDDSQSSAELPYTPGNDFGPDDEEPAPATGYLSGRGARAPDTDVTPHVPSEPAEPEEPPQPEDSGLDGGVESWTGNDDAAIPDIRAQRDELALQDSHTALSEPEESFELTSSSTPEPPQRPERFVEPAPPPPRAPRSEAPPAAPERVLRSVPGRYAGAGAPVLVARANPERASHEAPPVEEGPLSASLERISLLVSAFTAVALIFAGWHALHARLREPSGPERVVLANGEISSVEVLHLRDGQGRRVMAVRGLLQSRGGELPRVQLQLLDPQGSAVGTAQRARPGFLRDADLASEKLGRLLDPRSALPIPGEERGFTVLMRDPPLEADRFALELAR